MWDIRNWALLSLVLMVLYLGMCSSPRHDDGPFVRTDTVYVDKPLSPRDTANASKPNTVIIYAPSDELTKDVEIRVPERFLDPVTDEPRFWGIDRSSVHLSARELKLYTYDFELERDVQMVFRVPERRWDWGVDFVGDYYGPELMFLGLEARLAYRRVELATGPFLNPITGDVGMKGSLRINLRSR